MNLFGIVSPFVSAVNPRELITIYSSQGYTTATDGTRTPNAATPVQVLAQIQEATYDDLYQADGMNLSGEKLIAYLPGNWSGVIRADQKGGDIIVRANGTRWLVVAVPESWQNHGGWVKILMTRQLSA